jgi:superfamily II DNA or RNA helicase
VVWSFIRRAPALPNGGERVGEATSAVQPWPHQIRAFQRMYDAWPPRLLIADEVGLGKTIQAGLLLRQAWLAGKARRILILAPKAVLQQWQIELREKFNLHWPIYDGQKLYGYPSPGLRALQPITQSIGRQDWHRHPCVLASSQLLRRADRAPELLRDAEPWDLIVLDEAHHARRKGGGLGPDQQPNQLLRLMRQLRQRTAGLILLTATPMQISPVEVWDLLALLGLPPSWEVAAFLRFFEQAAAPLPPNQQLADLAALFRAVEAEYGAVNTADAQALMPGQSRLKAGKVLNILRAGSVVAFNALETDERRAAVRLMKAHTPLRRLISRHTRQLLRRYHQAGQLTLRIADRRVADRFVTLTPAERSVYTAVEDYIATTYQNAADTERTAVGFVMTIYRRRLASSFHALRRTLEKRLEATRGDRPDLLAQDAALAEDVLDDDIAEEAMDADDAAQLEQAALNREEQHDIERLLGLIRALPPDTKAERLLAELKALRAEGYPQTMIFTQYTDTLDFLRERLVTDYGAVVLCFSGRGGEIRNGAGWRVISRDDIKQRFRAGQAEILLCTDAAAEGLNFQFCGALIDYDMPWNPMRVEQRIGRIDRLGQQFPIIRIVNLHYADTVETDVYLVLRERIQLFETFVGRLQPILAKLPGAFARTALQDVDRREQTRHDLLDGLKRDLEQPAPGGLDLDEVTETALEMPPRPPALYDLQDLGRLLQRPELLPPGVEVLETGGNKDRAWQQPGMLEPVRVTTDPLYFEQHADSVELWSPGNPLFPSEPLGGEIDPPTQAVFRAVLTGPASSYSNPKSVVDVGWVSAQRVTQQDQDVGLRPTA